MNLYIYIGLILIALGTGLTIYGGFVRNKIENDKTRHTFNQKIEEVKSKIDDAKSSDLSDSVSVKDSLLVIEQDFQDWANEFLGTFEARKLDFKKMKLSEVDREITASKKARPVFDFLLNTIQNLTNVYREELGLKIESDFLNIPENLYHDDLKGSLFGKIKYSEDVIWKMGIYASREVEGELPSFHIEVDNSYDDNLHQGRISTLRFGLDEPGELVTVRRSEYFPLKVDIQDTIPISEYKKEFPAIVKKLVEMQILALSKE
ncbi:hypothetical protein CEE37_00125 [candidate division LCP-89 bacterium B3_LCP]|uniref:Uncharacterized protein n=1 Tax=candidate division LCP-89 bacterium B3_LCP TaxID=2012998 RepID=A0A532V558_UNCL8|nr:MAG: hypothetical protein CEE37_00125 [candidate division LCP-89 bacterium B3_LCP]